MILLSGFYATLANLSGQQDIVLGTPSDNRQHSQTQDLVGFFVNTLPLRLQVDAKASIATLIAQVHQQVTQAKTHQDLPFEKLVDALAIERDPSRHPLYQVIFTLDGFSDGFFDDNQLPWQAVIDYESIFAAPAKFDLSFTLADRQGGIEACFNYATSLFADAI